MPIKKRLAIPLTLLCALAVPGLRGSPESGTATADRNWTELISSMEKMHLAMGSVAPSGDTDADFVRLMLPHHQAAVDMAKSQLLYGQSPQMRRLAQEIIADQQSEIDLMRLWLKKHTPERELDGRAPSDSNFKKGN